MSTTCVTNTMVGVRACTYRSTHYADCDGIEYAWVEKRQREEATGRACAGCSPRRATNGLVCGACFTRITAALFAAPGIIRDLTGLARPVTPETSGRIATAIGYIPMTGTALAVDEISRLLNLGHGPADHWVRTYDGATAAIRLAIAVRSAQRAFPLAEDAHGLPRTRCDECEQLTLTWFPPAEFGSDVIVRCRNSECTRELDQASYEQISYIEGGKKPTVFRYPPWADKPEPVPYDPTNPEHQALLKGAA